MHWALGAIWHPLWLWAGAGAVSAAPLYALLREVVSRRISAFEFGLGLGALLSIWAAIQAFWGQPAGLVLLAYLVLAAGYVLVMCNRVASLSDRRVVERELRRAEIAVRRDATNAAARAYMGELHLRLGNAAEAVKELAEAVRLAPLPHYEGKLKEAVEAQRTQQVGQVRCRVCGTINPVGAMLCSKCGTTVAGLGFLAERVGVTYLGKPRWSAGLIFVPLLALSVGVGRLHPLLALGIMGVLSLACAVTVARLLRGW